jgi:hypothetical protein
VFQHKEKQGCMPMCLECWLLTQHAVRGSHVIPNKWTKNKKIVKHFSIAIKKNFFLFWFIILDMDLRVRWVFGSE